MLKRVYTADFINSVCNHPDVLPFVTGDDIVRIDFTEPVKNKKNVLLVSEYGGIFYECVHPRHYDGHIQFLPKGRGKHAARMARQSVDYMFTETDCIRILGRIPAMNKASKMLSIKTGFKFIQVGEPWLRNGIEEPTEWYALDKKDWRKKKW